MVHTMKDGEKILLAEMKDRHLRNTVAYLLRRFSGAKEVLCETVKRNKFDEALYGRSMDEDEAKDYVASFDRIFSPYIVECLIRGIDVRTYIDEYQELIQRRTMISISATQRRLLLEDFSSFGDEFNMYEEGEE